MTKMTKMTKVKTDEITTREAAQLLRCSPRTILRMIDRRSLHARKLDPSAKSVYRLSRKEVEELLRSQTSLARER